MTEPSQQSHSRIYGGLGRRFMALVVDFLCLSALFFALTKIIKGVWLMSRSDHLWGYGWLITDPLCLFFLGIIFFYFVILEGFFGATIGKRILNLKVVGENGRPPGIMKALARNILRIADSLPALNIVGVVLILTSPEKARLGDRLAGTRVIIRSDIKKPGMA